MRQLVEGSPVIARRVFETVFRRQMNSVLRPAVVGSVGLVVVHFRLRLRDNLLAGLYSFELRKRFRLKRWDPVDLLGIENGIDPMDERGSLVTVLVARRGIR